MTPTQRNKLADRIVLGLLFVAAVVRANDLP
jgi:hypothetical protein